MSGFNVTLGDGTVVSIKAGEKIEDIKNKFGAEAGTIFEGLDSNTNGVLDAGELDGLKTKLTENNYKVELAEDGRTPKRAFNDAMQNMRNKYDHDNLKGFYKADEAELYEVKKGDNLYTIAKKTLEAEGLPADFRSINDRIAQIANLNNINDVNNIRIGRKLVYKLTDEGVQKVKDSGNDSAVAFGGRTAPAGGNQGVNPAVDPAAGNQGGDSGETETPAALEGRESTITVSPNGLNMGSGVPVDKDGNELKTADNKNNFNDPKFEEGGRIMKYTQGDVIMYQTTYKESDGLANGVKLSAPTIEELQKIKQDFDAALAKVKAAPQDETEEAAAARKAENLAALKELVTISGGNIQVIRNVAEKLRDDNYVDRKSDAYKAFVQDILLTKNADALRALLYDAEDNQNPRVLTNDKTAHEIVAGMYQEIRAKEKAGEMLSPEEIALKEVVADYKRKGGYEIEANEENGIYEKYMSYDNLDGTPMYQVKIDGNWYYAKDPALLDEFLTKLQAADTDEKKAALFKEYANTTDTELAKCLAENAKTLCAADEDVISLINANGMVVLNKLPRPDDDIEYSKAVVDAVVSRMKEIYTTDKGNLENAVFLNNLEWVDKTDMSDEDKKKVEEEILETYFEVTTDEQGNKTYTFNPSRRPTYEEMEGLAHQCYYGYDAMETALVNYLKLEDMGKGQYSEAIEGWTTAYVVVKRFAEFIDGMSTKEEVIDFIDNKCSVSKNYNLPFDKILEKFPDDEDIKKRLFKEVDSGSTISDANRIVLAKLCMKDDGKGNVTFDKTKLPEGTDIRHFIEYVLPGNCQKGDAKKYFEAAIKVFGKDDLERIAGYKEKNPDSVKARIGELVKENTSDNEFIQNVMKLDKSVIPFDVLTGIDAVQAKWDDKTKAAVFEGTFDNRVLCKDRAKYFETAYQKHWITKVRNDLYLIGDNLYATNWYYKGADGEFETADDTVSLKKLSKTGFDHGVAMFNQLDGAGSGDIAKMLRGKKGEGYENYVTPDNVTGIIAGFNQMSPDEGLMEYIANEYGWSSGVKPGKSLCNRIPKALMRKAAAMNLTDTDAYKKLQAFFGADAQFNFTKNDEAGERYDSDKAKELDGYIKALYVEVVKNSGV